MSISGNSSEKLHCGNVVNMPYYTVTSLSPECSVEFLRLLSQSFSSLVLSLISLSSGLEGVHTSLQGLNCLLLLNHLNLHPLISHSELGNPAVSEKIQNSDTVEDMYMGFD